MWPAAGLIAVALSTSSVQRGWLMTPSSQGCALITTPIGK